MLLEAFARLLHFLLLPVHGFQLLFKTPHRIVDFQADFIQPFREQGLLLVVLHELTPLLFQLRLAAFVEFHLLPRPLHLLQRALGECISPSAVFGFSSIWRYGGSCLMPV